VKVFHTDELTVFCLISERSSSFYSRLNDSVVGSIRMCLHSSIKLKRDTIINVFLAIFILVVPKVCLMQRMV